MTRIPTTTRTTRLPRRTVVAGAFGCFVIVGILAVAVAQPRPE